MLLNSMRCAFQAHASDAHLGLRAFAAGLVSEASSTWQQQLQDATHYLIALLSLFW